MSQEFHKYVFSYSALKNSDEEEETTNPDLLADSESEGEDAEDILGRRQKEEPSNFEKRQDRVLRT